MTKKKKKWKNHSSLTQERREATGITMPKGIYLFGGYHSETKFEYLPTNGKIWQEGGKSIPGGFGGGCGVKINSEELVLIGGVGTGTRVLKFNTMTNTFTTWSTLNQGRFAHSCTVLDQNIIVVGGYALTGGSTTPKTASTEIISISNNGKSTMAATGNLNIARVHFGLVTLKGPLVLAFGGQTDSDRLDTIEKWNQETQQWKLVESTTLSEKKAFFGYLAVPASAVCSND